MTFGIGYCGIIFNLYDWCILVAYYNAHAVHITWRQYGVQFWLLKILLLHNPELMFEKGLIIDIYSIKMLFVFTVILCQMGSIYTINGLFKIPLWWRIWDLFTSKSICKQSTHNYAKYLIASMSHDLNDLLVTNSPTFCSSVLEILSVSNVWSFTKTKWRQKFKMMFMQQSHILLS